MVVVLVQLVFVRYARMRSVFPHDSTVIFARFCAEEIQEFCADSCGKWWNPAGTYVRSYVQCLYVHSQHTSFIRSIKWPETWNVNLYICTIYPSSIESVRLRVYPRTSSALYRSAHLPHRQSAYCRTGVRVLLRGYLQKTYTACLRKKVSFPMPRTVCKL